MPTSATDPHKSLEAPSPWIRRFLSLLEPGGDVLDVACGSGRHARLLRNAGHRVIGIDRDSSAIAALIGDGIEGQVLDLENSPDGRPSWPFAAGRFAGIVVTNYLYRPLLPLLADGLKPGGILLYETFAVGNEAFGKPSNPDFLLRPGELLDAVRNASGGPMQVVAYESGRIASPRPAIVQRICAIRDATGAAPLPAA